MDADQLFAKMYRAEFFPGGKEAFRKQVQKIELDLQESDRLYAISNPKRVGGLQDKVNAMMTAEAITATQINDLLGLAERKLEAAKNSYQSYLEEEQDN